MEERENEISLLRKQNELLQIKHEEILAELGEITIKNTAKENEEKRSKLFEQIFGSQINAAKDSSVSVRAMGDDKKSSHVNSSQNSLRIQNQNIGENNEAPLSSSSIVCEAAACEQPVVGATALPQRSNHQPEISEIVKSDIAALTKKTHENHMCFTCDSHVFTCDSHVLPCDSHVISCDSHVIFIMYHVIHM